MHFLALAQDLAIDTSHFHYRYTGVGEVSAISYESLYLAVGAEIGLIRDQLRQKQQLLDATCQSGLASATAGAHFIEEDALLAWPQFPARLGRISSRFREGHLHLHTEDQPLPAQLKSLQARKPEKRHFRFAIVNGFGWNLGDCTMGMAAFRTVLEYLRAHFFSLSCDFLLGPNANVGLTDILGHEPEIEQVLFQLPTAAEFARYDGYFDFTNLLALPRLHSMPFVDWVLWWCGLDPESVPPERKRNRGHIRSDAWNAIAPLWQAHPGLKVLFNSKASVALRTMPAGVAADFALQLLDLAPEITLVVDQPLDCQHPRLLDVSEHIGSPEKFRALVGQVDGVVTVNSFASHMADVCAVPTVHLCVTVPGHFYPYYPFMATLNPCGYEALPAFGQVKVEEAAWESMQEAYEAAWRRIAPAQVVALLREKMAQRSGALAEPCGLTVGAGRMPARYVALDGVVPQLQRQRMSPVHRHASERLAQLTQQLLKSGSVCVMACAPDAGLALTLAERMVPHGELIVMEPRAPLARNVEAALHLAGMADMAKVLQVVGLAGVTQAQIPMLDPWSESCSSEWGNVPVVTSVPSQTVDALALARCSALVIQSPMPCVAFITGALQTLHRCRPFILLTPASREEAAALCHAVEPVAYDFWAEMALPAVGVEGGSEKSANAWLLVGVPREQPVQIAGFTKLKLG